MARLIQVTRTVTQTYYVRVENAPTTRLAAQRAREYADNVGESADPSTRIGEWRAHVCERDDADIVHVTLTLGQGQE